MKIAAIYIFELAFEELEKCSKYKKLNPAQKCSTEDPDQFAHECNIINSYDYYTKHIIKHQIYWVSL